MFFSTIHLFSKLSKRRTLRNSERLFCSFRSDRPSTGLRMSEARLKVQPNSKIRETPLSRVLRIWFLFIFFDLKEKIFVV